MKTKKKTRETIDMDGIDPGVYARRWKVLGAMCVTLLVAVLANSSLNLALPMMSVDLGLTTLEMTWIVEIYMLVFAALLFTAAAVGDRYGRRLIMQIGLGVFIASSAYAGFIASTGTELIIARAVMGIGGAMVMPTTLSIINTTFPRRERAKAIATWGAIAGVGISIGNIFSGVLMQTFTWHSVFFFSMILAAVSLLMNMRYVHESRDEAKNPVDWLGGLLSTVGLVGVVYAIMEAPTHGFGADVVVMASVGALALVAFVAWQLKTASPMLDMKLFRNTAFSISSLTLTLVFFAQMAIFFSLSQMMQSLMGYSPLESSLLTIPFMIPMALVAPRVPRIVQRFGARWTVVAGLLAIAAAFFAVAFVWPTQPAYWMVLVTMAVMMAGSALATTPGTNILMASVPRNRSGMGSAVNDTTRELGGALGIAILGSMMSSGYTQKIAETASQFGGDVKTLIEGSIATALEASKYLGAAGEAVAAAARESWMAGFSEASIVAGCVLLVAAGIAAVWLPHEHNPDSDIF